MKVLKVIYITLLVILFAKLNHTYAQEAGTLKTVLTNCNVIDCTGAKPMKNMTVVITGNKITDIKRGMYRPSPGEKEVRLFDLKGGYVLPGLWNVHTHIGDILPDPKHPCN